MTEQKLKKKKKL